MVPSRPGFSSRLCSQRGQSAVEFAIAVPVVLVLFMGIFDFSRFFYTKITLQHAIHEAARFAVTGSTLDDDLGNPMTRAESITSVIQDRAASLDLDVDQLIVDPSDGGGPSDIVTVTGTFRFHFITPGIKHLFPNGTYDFTVSTALKNEPFLVGT